MTLNFWKILNYLVLACLVLICSLGTFYKHIAFGWGLGDMLWYLIMYGVTLTHLVLTILYRKKGIKRHGVLALIFLVITLYICLEATIWRDGEYPWNGEVFYKY